MLREEGVLERWGGDGQTDRQTERGKDRQTD